MLMNQKSRQQYTSSGQHMYKAERDLYRFGNLWMIKLKRNIIDRTNVLRST
jgi:hypothetical protein